MNTELYEDDQGNNMISAEAVPDEVTSESTSQGSGPKRPSDFCLAEQAVNDWKRPLAFHAGELWSFTLERGWEVVTDRVLALCNKLRGQETSKSVFSILTNQLKTPNMEHVQVTSTYWKRVGGVWDGEWQPFPVSSDEVVFSNGVLNLKTNKFQKMDKQVVFGPRITIPYQNMKETCQEFEDMLEFALPDGEIRNYLQKICATILQPHQTLRSQIVFWGVPHSGKTTLATAIGCAPAGLVGVTFMTESRIVSDKFASTPLINKFANVSNDSEFTKKWESWMKSYTSGTVTVEPKFHKPTSLPATAKMISTCNEMQKMSDSSGASEQRYRIFEFRKPVVETGDIGQTDRMQPSYWCVDERRKGIVGWLLRGLKKAIKEGISEPACMKKSKRDAISNSDPLFDWIHNSLELNVNSFMTTTEIVDAIPSDIEGATAQRVGPMMERVWGLKKGRLKGERGFKGIALKA